MAKVSPSIDDPSMGSSISLGQRSLHFEDKAVNVEEQGVSSPSYGLVNHEVAFMKRRVKCRECVNYIEVPNQDPSLSEDDRLCGCSYPKKEHSKAAKENSKGGQWDYTQNTKQFPTNAFGDIEFVGYGDKVGKYVRVDVDTPMDTMLGLLTNAWGMEKPNLLISVTGGAKNFTMKARLREVFRRGLMKAALSTGAWIVTGGTNAGVMKHVGEAVRDYGLTTEGRVMTIGIAPWGCVQNKEHLIEKKRGQGKWPAAYRIENEVKKRQSFLDPNHSHFILVDNGTQHQFTVEIPFRAKLEEAIGSQKTDTGADAVAVPVCLLVLEGGPGTLQTVHSALNSRTPTVVIKGSGKTADILAYAYQNAREEETIATDHDGKQIKGTRTELDQHVMAEITEMVRTHFGEASLSQRVSWVRDCCKNLDLLSVFELDSKHSAKDVDLAILKALLKANKNQVMDQLKLALAWNRIDVAKSEIFTDERRWPTGMLDDVMMSAIQLNRVDFVDLFLDHGVSLKDFLTVKRLLALYNGIPKNCQLYTLLSRVKDKHRKLFSLADVGFLLQDLLGDYYQPHHLTDSRLKDLNVDLMFGIEDETPGVSKGMNAVQKMTSSAATGAFVDPSQATDEADFSRPAQELFIWCVLMNHHKLSKLFWRELNESCTAAALFANSILESLKKVTVDQECKQRLDASATDYASLSVGVINTCYSTDENRTHDILIRDMPHWGKSTCVFLAARSGNKPFIAQTACQTLLNRVWRGKISQDTRLLTIIVCTFIPPLLFSLINFREDDEKNEKDGIPVDDVAADKPDKKKNNKISNEAKIVQPKREATTVRPGLSRQATAFNIDTQPVGKNKGYSAWQKYWIFYHSPIVKFILNVACYVIFLLLYSYILVVQLSREFHISEGVLIGWVVTIFLEEIRQFLTGYAFSLKTKVSSYFHDSWNILDILTISLFTLGMVLRFIDSDTTLSIARVVLSINLTTFFSRILHIFSISQRLGPKLVMIKEMLQDLMSFVVILLVFVISYAIASEAVLYPNSELNWKLLYYLPRKAYWHIYGELFLEDIEGDNPCTDDPALYNNYDTLRCPSPVGKYFVPIFLGVYILMTNVLLLNLLIAMFSNTFQQIQANTDMHWCFQTFNLVHEYTLLPALPPPFSVFSHVFMIINKCCRMCGKAEERESNDFRKIFHNRVEEKQLLQWENVIADNYLNATERSEQNSIAGRVKSSMQRLEMVLAKVDELQESQGQNSGQPSALSPSDTTTVKLPSHVEKRIESVEDQLGHTAKALEWIMASLQEHNMAAKAQKPLLPNLQEKRKEEERKKKELEERNSKLVKDLLEKKIESHFKSRISPYPGTNVYRFSVPDEKVLWEIDFPEYSPPTFTSVEVLKMPSYADIDLLSMLPADRVNAITFNQPDCKCNISRVSFSNVPYKVIDGLPINPRGRTGLKGRGSLGRWGPNQAGDPIVTRWKMDSKGNCEVQDGKPVLEFVAVQRLDNDMWSIPGAICGPGEEPLNVIKTDFQEDVSGSLLDDPEEREKIITHMNELATVGVEVYKGYSDDPRNTDNAWIETKVVNYHDANGTILKDHFFRASEDVKAVTWQPVTSTLMLHGSHAFFLKLVAEKHEAAF